MCLFAASEAGSDSFWGKVGGLHAYLLQGDVGQQWWHCQQTVHWHCGHESECMGSMYMYVTCSWCEFCILCLFSLCVYFNYSLQLAFILYYKLLTVDQFLCACILHNTTTPVSLQGDITRYGERKLAGLMKDGYNSAQRYYMNIFRDTYRQVLIGKLLKLHVHEKVTVSKFNLRRASPTKTPGYFWPALIHS